ncbi:MAG: hypothetical protein K2W94_00050 [Alphaproteobacteria bacterium]|nr:hypothetical protein [Alphaproteobacteria bacterium]
MTIGLSTIVFSGAVMAKGSSTEDDLTNDSPNRGRMRPVNVTEDAFDDLELRLALAEKNAKAQESPVAATRSPYAFLRLFRYAHS